MKRASVVVLVLLAAAFGLAAGSRPSAPVSVPREVVNTEMAVAARALLDSLSGELRAKAAVAFNDAARTDWHYIPRTRPGVTLGELSEAQRTLVQALLRSALSSQGTLKINAIVDLESVLRDLEKGNPARDPGKYTLAIYGEPPLLQPSPPPPPPPLSAPQPAPDRAAKPWGWKIEGHHISLNFTSSGTVLTSVTPAFLGSNPASVPGGAQVGRRVLAAEEDLGRALVTMLDPEQRRAAIIADTAPTDVILGPGRGFDQAPAAGLPASKMTPAQREALWAIVEEFAHNLRRELAESELARIRGVGGAGGEDGAGIDLIHFAWAGSLQPGEGHYYRLRGPTFVIEFDNTQNNANHAHALWRDTTRDFASDPLKEHYEHGHEHEHK